MSSGPRRSSQLNDQNKGEGLVDLNSIIQVVLGTVIAAIGFFLKRAFEQMDESVKRIHAVEIDVAALNAETRDMDARLERIEDKLDRLLER